MCDAPPPQDLIDLDFTNPDLANQDLGGPASGAVLTGA